jgi:hypothetical protein
MKIGWQKIDLICNKITPCALEHQKLLIKKTGKFIYKTWYNNILFGHSSMSSREKGLNEDGEKSSISEERSV